MVVSVPHLEHLFNKQQSNRSLLDVEKWYSQTEKLSMVLVWAVEMF